ncbi:MAG: hypothetical protein ABIK65_10780 [Candidatus Eisenbacteria bacterium]
MEDLSRVYFSSASFEPVAARPPEKRPAPVGTSGPAAFVTVANAAGGRGESFLHELRLLLSGRGHSSFQVRGVGGGYRVDGEPGAPLSPAALLDRIRGGSGPSILFLMLAEEEGADDPALLRSGDASLLLAGPEIQDLRRAYARLRGAIRGGGGTVPAIVPVDGSDAWTRIAPLRLAEAATRFLGIRVPVWGGGDAAEAARLVAGRLKGVGERKEHGSEPLARRLMAVIGGAP